MPRLNPAVEGVDADALGSFLGTLEEMSAAANGYGHMIECAVEMEEDGQVVFAKYSDDRWRITIKEK